MFVVTASDRRRAVASEIDRCEGTGGLITEPLGLSLWVSCEFQGHMITIRTQTVSMFDRKIQCSNSPCHMSPDWSVHCTRISSGSEGSPSGSVDRPLWMVPRPSGWDGEAPGCDDEGVAVTSEGRR